MRYLSIDYGRKRVGVARSDPDGKIAFPVKTITGRDSAALLEELTAMVRADGIDFVVVGLPQVLPGGDPAFYREVRAFGRTLAVRCGAPVAFADERFTSKIADEFSPDATDAAAAALILQGFLDRPD
jgi:putative Holliday junction resolvase